VRRGDQQASSIGAIRVFALIVGLREEQPQEHEGDDPREVEVEPVGQRDLERDEHRGRQRRELKWALASGNERHDHGERDRENDDHGLHHTEVGDAARAVLAPAPDGER
jgi:hypothetical protein